MSILFIPAPPTTRVYTLSLHDALPIYSALRSGWARGQQHLSGGAAVIDAPVGRGRVLALGPHVAFRGQSQATLDRKSTRLNSSHPSISYAVFCLKKKKTRHRGRVKGVL